MLMQVIIQEKVVEKINKNQICQIAENLDISMSPKVSLSPQKLSARLKLGSGKNGRGGGG